MGTRSLTVLKKSGTEVAVLYRQLDGYPSGHGAELANFLTPFTIVNGIGAGAELGKTANGAGCLFAQLVAHFKDDVGGIYLYAAGTRDCGEEYVYTVTVAGELGGQHVELACYKVNGGYRGEPRKELLWKGKPAEFPSGI